MEAIESQAFGRQSVHRRRGSASAKRAELSEAGIVDQDQHDVRCVFRCLHGLRELRCIGLQISAADMALEVGIGTGQDLRCARGFGRSRNHLRISCRCASESSESNNKEGVDELHEFSLRCGGCTRRPPPSPTAANVVFGYLCS